MDFARSRFTSGVAPAASAAARFASAAMRSGCSFRSSLNVVARSFSYFRFPHLRHAAPRMLLKHQSNGLMVGVMKSMDPSDLKGELCRIIRHSGSGIVSIGSEAGPVCRVESFYPLDFFNRCKQGGLRFREISRVLVRLINHVARMIVNANHSIM